MSRDYQVTLAPPRLKWWRSQRRRSDADKSCLACTTRAKTLSRPYRRLLLRPAQLLSLLPSLTTTRKIFLKDFLLLVFWTVAIWSNLITFRINQTAVYGIVRDYVFEMTSLHYSVCGVCMCVCVCVCVHVGASWPKTVWYLSTAPCLVKLPPVVKTFSCWKLKSYFGGGGEGV